MTSILSTEFWLKFNLASAAVGESTRLCTPGGGVGVVCVDLKGRLVNVCGRTGEGGTLCVKLSVVMVVAVVVLVLVLTEVVVIVVVVVGVVEEEEEEEGEEEAEADMEAAAAFKGLEPDTVELVTGDTILVCRVSTSTAVAGGESMVVEAVAATGGRTITVVAGVGTGSAARAVDGTTNGVGAVRNRGRFDGRRRGGVILGFDDR